MPLGRELPMLVGTFSHQLNGSTEGFQVTDDAELRSFPHLAWLIGLDRGYPPYKCQTRSASGGVPGQPPRRWQGQ